MSGVAPDGSWMRSGMIEPLKIALFPSVNGWPEASRIFIAAGLGMSIALAEYTPSLGFQIRCSPERTAVISEPSEPSTSSTQLDQSLRRCKSCGEQRSLWEFASKGRDRLGSLCKDCDNKRRRTGYSPKAKPDWDNAAVAIESVEGDHPERLQAVLWEMVVEQRLINVGLPETTQSMDDLLGRRNAVDRVLEKSLG